MKKYKSILKEGLSKIVYHTTNFHNAIDILKTNKFELTFSLGTDSDKNLQPTYKPFYISFSRIKFGGYARSFSPNKMVTFVMDGDKFNQRYKGGPVDYWGSEMRKHSFDAQMRNDENEERLFSDKPSIPNASKYIKEIHAIELEYDLIFNLSRLAKDYSIPMFVYKNPKDFMIMRKGENWLNDKKQDYEYLLEILEAQKESELSKKAQDILYDLRSLDFVRVLKSNIHNNRTNPVKKEVFAKINNIMKKNKLKNIEEFVDFVKKIANQKFNLNL